MKKINYILSIISFGVLAFAISCSSDDGGDPVVTLPIDEESYRATIINVQDMGDNGGSNDIQVLFNGGSNADISAYKIFVVPSATTDVSAEDLDGLADNRFTEVMNDASSYAVTLDANQQDISGAPVEEGKSYVLYVLTIGTFQNEAVLILSSASQSIQLEDTSVVPETPVSTLISNFPANDGLFVASDGTVYASNFGQFDTSAGEASGTRVYKVNSEGQAEVLSSNLQGPLGGVLDEDQGIYYLSDGNSGSSGRFSQVSSDGVVTEIATLDGWPSGSTRDADGNIYIANYAAPNIHKVDVNLEVTVFATDERLNGCVGIDIDDDGNIITANFNNGDILKVDQTGEVSLIATISGVVPNFGIGYMTIFEGAIYATGIGNHRIYKVDFDGTVEVFAGDGMNASIDGELLEASFSSPNGIAADEDKRILYISQFGLPGLRTIKF